MASLFTDRDVWYGGAVDLVILAGSRADGVLAEADARLDVLLNAVWAAPALAGPYARRDVEPDDQPLVAATLRAEQEHGLYGVARLAAGPAACVVQVVRDDPGDYDWVYVDLPLGGLHHLGLRIDGPDADDAAWTQVRELLLGVARSVYAVIPFAAAGIGHELQGPDVADYLTERETSGLASDWLLGSDDGLRHVPSPG